MNAVLAWQSAVQGGYAVHFKSASDIIEETLNALERDIRAAQSTQDREPSDHVRIVQCKRCGKHHYPTCNVAKVSPQVGDANE